MQKKIAVAFTLALVFTLIQFIPQVVAVSTFTEDFDDDTPPRQPTEDWYTLTSGGSGSAFVTGTNGLSSPNSYEMSGSTITTLALSVDVCTAGTTPLVKAAVYFVSATAGGVILALGTNAYPADDHVRVDYNSGTGVFTLVVNGDGTQASQTSPAQATQGNWIPFTVSFDNCGSSIVSLYFPTTGNSISVDDGGSLTAITHLHLFAAAATVARYDNIELLDVADPPAPTVAADATSATFTNLYGFSIDRTDTLGIVRTDSGDFIRTLAGQALTTTASEDTDCTRQNAVLSQRTPTGPLVFYMDCEPGGNPDTFKVRNNLLNVPNVNGCTQADCWDLDSNEFDSTADDDVSEIGEMVQIPIDLTVRGESTAADFWQLSWAWAGQGSRAGEIGVAAQTVCITNLAADLCDDDFHMARANFGGDGTSPSDICTGYSPSLAVAYVAVADISIPTTIYPVSFSNETDQFGTRYLDVSLGQPGTASSSKAVACGGDLIAIVYNSLTQLAVIDVQTGGPLFEISCSCVERGIAISHVQSDGEQFLAWLESGGTWKLANMTGSVVATGSWTNVGDHWVEMGANAQNLYIASNNRVQRFKISTVTGVEGTGGAPSVPPTGGLPGGFAGLGGPINDIFGGIGEEASDAIAGLILCLIFAAVGFMVFGGVTAVQAKSVSGVKAASMGAMAAFTITFFAVGFAGAFPGIVMFGVIALILIIGVAYFRR